MLVFAFVLTFCLSVALFHYQEPIAAFLTSRGAGLWAGEELEVDAAAAVTASLTKREVAVQVAAYESRARADALAERLAAYGEEIEVSPVNLNGRAYYRVRILMETVPAAERLAARLRSELSVDAWVVYLP